MACTGLSMENGLTNASEEEYRVKEAVTANSMERFVLADHSKFGIFSLMTYCPLEKIHYILTDQPVPEEYEDFCSMNSITVETIG